MAEEGGAPFGQTVFTPVLVPKEKTSLRLGKRARFVNLLLALPPRGRQGGGQTSAPKREGSIRGLAQAKLEAFEASCPTLRLVLETMDKVEPCVVVIRTLDPLETERLGMAAALVAAMDVLFERKYVGIIVVDYRTDIVGEHPLDNGRGAWRTTGVEHGRLGRRRRQRWAFHFIMEGRVGCRGIGNFGGQNNEIYE